MRIADSGFAGTFFFNGDDFISELELQKAGLEIKQPHQVNQVGQVTVANFLISCEKEAQKRFQFSELRDYQKNALALIHQNKFCLATLPTGAGKTLLYALPAAVDSVGKVLVICPLVALMRDQAERLVRAGYLASALHSQLSESHTNLVGEPRTIANG
jgi:superfamily II DNA helicase RecQ